MPDQFPPRLEDKFYLTEGGVETEILYKWGYELPEFAVEPHGVPGGKLRQGPLRQHAPRERKAYGRQQRDDEDADPASFHRVGIVRGNRARYKGAARVKQGDEG